MTENPFANSDSPSLRGLDSWQVKYNQPPLHLGKAFYGPALTRSTIYRRTTGYFNSSMLTEISEFLDDFCARGGKMQLITSPDITKQDLDAIERGEELLKERLHDIAAAQIEEMLAESETFSAKDKDRFQLLTGMLERGDLEIKFAAGSSKGYFELFHEKSGYFEDTEGNYISFTGSANETKSGIGQGNVEAITIFPDWVVSEYALKHKEDFDELWSDEREGVYIGSYSQALKDKLFEAFPPREPDLTRKRKVPVPAILLPGKLIIDKKPFEPLPNMFEGDLHRYQTTAIAKWNEAGRKGIFKMATGTGKTFTALAAATELALNLSEEKMPQPLLVIVTAPAVDLVDQWAEEAKKFNWNTSVCHGDLSVLMKRKLEAAFNNVSAKFGRFAEMVITTNNSITPSEINKNDPYLLRKIDAHNGHLLFIGDEMHSLGSTSTLQSLPEKAQYRIGLSATPERYKDPEGTKGLFDFFGEPVIEIDIHDAIHKYKTLCHYDYFAHFVELTNEETKLFREYSAKIAQNMHAGGEGHPWVGKRQRVMQHADGKMTELKLLLETKLHKKSHIFVYSPEGYDPDNEESSEQEGIHATEQIEEIMQDCGFKVKQYNGQTKIRDRKKLQRNLANGDIDALISMKCLDQGVDVPEARIGVFLSSTKNSQQFVQRRGRILRKSTGKHGAKLFDMIVRPPLSDDITPSEQRLLRSELSRAAELAYSADNKDEQLIKLREYSLSYKLEFDNSPIPWLDGEKPTLEVISATNLEADSLSI